MREGIAVAIGRNADMEVVASAANGEQAVDLFKGLAMGVLSLP
jgi:DNA-binding NarL/FixJ family response regulator